MTEATSTDIEQDRLFLKAFDLLQFALTPRVETPFPKHVSTRAQALAEHQAMAPRPTEAELDTAALTAVSYVDRTDDPGAAAFLRGLVAQFSQAQRYPPLVLFQWYVRQVNASDLERRAVRSKLLVREWNQTNFSLMCHYVAKGDSPKDAACLVELFRRTGQGIGPSAELPASNAYAISAEAILKHYTKAIQKSKR